MEKNTFKPNDRVAVINDTIKGVVQAVSDKSVAVLTDEGFTFFYKPEELVLQGVFDKLLEEKPVKKEEHSAKSTSRKKKIIPDYLEVDLHIHELIDSHNGMNNYEILQLQLQTARDFLRTAMQKKIRKVIFIHGVGEGVLKTELRKMLKNYPVDIFDASFQKYGFGATEVRIYGNFKGL